MGILQRLDEDKLRETATFMAKFAFAGLIFRAILFLHPDTYVLESTLASVSGSLLESIGTPAEVIGNRIKVENSIFLVNQDCLGWKSIAAFTGLSWASRINNMKKTILIGITGLIFLNIIRIVTTIKLSTSGIVSFDLLHIFLWRWGLTAAVLGLWIFHFYQTKKPR